MATLGGIYKSSGRSNAGRGAFTGSCKRAVRSARKSAAHPEVSLGESLPPRRFSAAHVKSIHPGSVYKLLSLAPSNGEHIGGKHGFSESPCRNSWDVCITFRLQPPFNCLATCQRKFWLTCWKTLKLDGSSRSRAPGLQKVFNKALVHPKARSPINQRSYLHIHAARLRVSASDVCQTVSLNTDAVVTLRCDWERSWHHCILQSCL